jgi:hypothetical protein
VSPLNTLLDEQRVRDPAGADNDKPPYYLYRGEYGCDRADRPQASKVDDLPTHNGSRADPVLKTETFSEAAKSAYPSGAASMTRR